MRHDCYIKVCIISLLLVCVLALNMLQGSVIRYRFLLCCVKSDLQNNFLWLIFLREQEKIAGKFKVKGKILLEAQEILFSILLKSEAFTEKAALKRTN